MFLQRTRSSVCGMIRGAAILAVLIVTSFALARARHVRDGGMIGLSTGGGRSHPGGFQLVSVSGGSR
jgi:hypothetical protein